MKKSTKIILMAAICFLSVGIVIMGIGLATGASIRTILQNGMWNSSITYSDDYDNQLSEDGVYHAESDFKSLQIGWISGDVTVEVYDGEDVEIVEESDVELTEDTCLRYKVARGNLEISAYKDAMSISFSNTDDISKDLTVKIPRELAENLNVEITSFSSDIHMEGIHGTALGIDISSGNFTGNALKFDYVDLQSMSGSMEGRFLSTPTAINCDTSSGDCTLYLPKRAGFTVEMETSSGSFSTDFSVNHHHSDDGVYTVGNGNSIIAMDSLSGSMTINKN